MILIILILSSCKKQYKTNFQTPEVTVHFIDVGNGDSILIQSSKGNVLIDGGSKETEKMVMQYINDVGVTHFNYIIATHPHSDHIGGLKTVIKNIVTDNIYMPKVIHTTATYKNFIEEVLSQNLNVIEPKPLEEFYVDDIKFTILSPISSDYGNLNDYSIVVKMEYGKTSFLFTGDMELVSENEIIQKKYDIKADVLKVAHHGSKTSSSPEFIAKIDPRIAVISVGTNNSYNHPSDETIKTLDDFNIKILRTDELGCIVIKTDGKNITY
jgi:competence protein ComEC